MKILLAEDRFVSRLWPLAVTGPAYGIYGGGRTLVDCLSRQGYLLHGLVRSHLQEVQQHDFTGRVFAPPDHFAEPWVLLNARCIPGRQLATWFANLDHSAMPRVWADDDHWVAARFDAAQAVAQVVLEYQAGTLDAWLRRLPAIPVDSNDYLFQTACDVIRVHHELLTDELAFRIATEHWQQPREGVFVHPTAEIDPSVVLQTAEGPIVVEAEARIDALSVLRGPLLIAARARVHPHSWIRPPTVIGPGARAGGEITASILDAFANKQHYGYIGHSHVGRWVNLGAGTTNSDLKHTYGNVRMELEGQRRDTQMQFFGTVVGDCTKAAIQTGIQTGKLIGIGCMLMGNVNANIPDFTHRQPEDASGAMVDVDLLLRAQERMMARRGQMLRDHERRLFRTLHAREVRERSSSG